MHDSDIRKALKAHLKTLYQDSPDTLILDELCLFQGATRVDVAVIDHEIIGYEIKSDQDTLARLPAQAELYNRVLDRVVLVVGSSHLDRVVSMVPDWWGIQEAIPANDSVMLVVRREPGVNPGVDPNALVQLLWRDEALAILEELGLDRGLRSKSRPAIWNALVEHMTLDELKAAVRSRMKSRPTWRVTTQKNTSRRMPLP